MWATLEQKLANMVWYWILTKLKITTTLICVYSLRVEVGGGWRKEESTSRERIRRGIWHMFSYFINKYRDIRQQTSTMLWEAETGQWRGQASVLIIAISCLLFLSLFFFNNFFCNGMFELLKKRITTKLLLSTLWGFWLL